MRLEKFAEFAIGFPAAGNLEKIYLEHGGGFARANNCGRVFEICRTAESGSSKQKAPPAGSGRGLGNPLPD